MKEEYFIKKSRRYSQKMIQQNALKTEQRQDQLIDSIYQSPCNQKTYKNQSLHIHNLQSSKFDLINDLLLALKYNTTNQIFQKERNKVNQCRNPQNSGQKIKLSSHKNKNANIDKALERAICQSKSFEQMLSFMEGIVKKSNKQQKMVEQNYVLNQKDLERGNIERAIQEIFPQKQTATIPIFKSLQIQYQNKQIKLIDIDINDNVCFLDNQHNIYLIQAEQQEKAITTKLQQKKHIVNLKWVNSQVIVLLSASNKIFFYQTSKLSIIKIIKHYKKPIHLHQIYTFNIQPSKTILFILSVSQQKFLPLKISCNNKEIHVEGQTVFEQKFQIKAITMIKIPHTVTFHQKLEESNEPCEIIVSTDIEHFYGLTKNLKNIVKYDSYVEKSGIIWQTYENTSIWELNCSKCAYFLIVLIVSQPDNENEQMYPEQQQFTFLKMNGDGGIIQKINFQLTNIPKNINYGRQIFYNFENLRKSNIKWSQLQPQWLRCYVYNNRLIYLSIRSGNIIYSQQIEGNDIKLRAVGPSNSLLYEIDKRLLMYSTKQTKKRKIILQNKRQNEFRQSIIQRFARLQGVPQNLLILLRSIRNHDLNFMENP